MLKNWINIFFYHIKNNKLFTVLNVLGLAIGIAGLIFATLYWNDEQSYNEWNPEKNNIHMVINKVNNEQWPYTVGTLGKYFDGDPNIESYNYSFNWYDSELFSYNGKKQKIEKAFNTQSKFFDYFPFPFIFGNDKNALKDDSSIAISEKIYKIFFNNENPIGKQIKFGKNFYTVNGVYKNEMKSSFAPDVVLTDNFKKIITKNLDQWETFNFCLLLKLKTNASKEAVERKIEKLFIENVIKKEANEANITLEQQIKEHGIVAIHLETLSDARLNSELNENWGYPEGIGNYQYLIITVVLSILIMILSIVNYVNLANASAIKRAKEVGMRKILGASRRNIIAQFISETIIIVLVSILFALVIVEISLPFYNELLEKDLKMYGSEFYLQLLFIFGIVVFLGGFFPALYISSFETQKVLKGNFNRSKMGIWFRNSMLVFQFAIAVFFIIGSTIVYQQVSHLTNKNLGFKGDKIIEIDYLKKFDTHSDESYQNEFLRDYLRIKDRLAKVKGVSQVATGNFSFGKGARSSRDYLYQNANVQGLNMAVDFGMLEMMDIKLKEGRYFNNKYASDTINNVIINETAVRILGIRQPIGKEIVSGDGEKLKIISVVKDFNLRGPQEKKAPMIFVHLKTFPLMAQNVNSIFVKVNTANIENTINDIEQFWTTKVDTEYPFSYEFVDKKYARSYKEYVKQKNLFSLLNVVVIVIALFGLFALASYSIERRMKEIAIRKTLGAETNVLLIELSKQYILYCIIGFLIALFPVYYLLNKWLENFAYRIEISIFPFVIGFVALLFLTLVVVLSRAYQATRVDVLKYLKYE
ncbi:ABC transporter permease [Flavobacterium sp. I-SCBP12n]|uniref:ABC transporter permease n=1 Tax=Flavobacterium pygoscelis TaxID=2893176 RepID=A0A9X2BLL3_9FLAO|nr:ABC transporter permease [Flavobacterium pygoscelis]MCK8142719.1 ABC transporter permease [Flavobacterium pygoscelis]